MLCRVTKLGRVTKLCLDRYCQNSAGVQCQDKEEGLAGWLGWHLPGEEGGCLAVHWLPAVEEDGCLQVGGEGRQ